MVVRCVKRPRTGTTEREASEIRASSQEQETEEAIIIAAECLSCRLAERAAFFVYGLLSRSHDRLRTLNQSWTVLR
jgi:hypothetical protein